MAVSRFGLGANIARDGAPASISDPEGRVSRLLRSRRLPMVAEVLPSGPGSATSATPNGLQPDPEDPPIEDNTGLSPAPTPAPTEEPSRSKNRWGGCLLEIVETVVLTVIIFFVVQHFVAQPYQIQQVSMKDTLQPGQYVLVDKLSPNFSDYKRGDIIVFTPPDGYQDLEGGQNVPFIKRVIGVAGDVVEIRNNSIYVNGVQLQEPYVFEGQPTQPLNGQSRWVVPSGYLFVLGDHREQSQDSRVFGPIARSSVIGRAWLRYWPFSNFGFVGSASYNGIPSAP
jgi:signal peptidase I